MSVTNQQSNACGVPCSRGLARVAAVMIALPFAFGAMAQNAPAPRPVEPPAAQPQRAPEPGLFGAFGRWVDETIAGISSTFRDARGRVGNLGDQAGDAAKDAAAAARDAAETVARIPGTTIVTGRERCLRAANGGPDCTAATDALCRSKGYKTGRGLDVQSAQKCPASVWLSGRQPAEGECPVETYVTRAVCQ